MSNKVQIFKYTTWSEQIGWQFEYSNKPKTEPIRFSSFEKKLISELIRFFHSLKFFDNEFIRSFIRPIKFRKDLYASQREKLPS